MDSEKDLFDNNISAILAIGGKKQNTDSRPKNAVDDSIRQRAKHMVLKVTFPDGKVFCYNRATTTFTEVIRYIGCEKVASVGLEANRYSLILKDVPEELKSSCEPLDDGWYANMRGSDTSIKYRQLQVINRVLDLNLMVEMGMDFETTKKVQFGRTRKIRESMLVQFPDGTFVGGDNPIDTYRDTIMKIGVDVIQRKGIEIAGKQLISLNKRYSNQEEIGSYKWLTIPGTTKEKMKWLKLLALTLHLKLEITTI